MMLNEKWEYKIAKIRACCEEEELNKLGEECWECVSSSYEGHFTVFIFKRRKIESDWTKEEMDKAMEESRLSCLTYTKEEIPEEWDDRYEYTQLICAEEKTWGETIYYLELDRWRLYNSSTVSRGRVVLHFIREKIK